MSILVFVLSLFCSAFAFSQELKIQCSEKSEFKSFSLGNYSFENRPLTTKEKEDLLKKLRAKQAQTIEKLNGLGVGHRSTVKVMS